jgi:hypothetical protein
VLLLLRAPHTKAQLLTRLPRRYGWGTSFHFAQRTTKEALAASISRHEHFLALKLGLSSNKSVIGMSSSSSGGGGCFRFLIALMLPCAQIWAVAWVAQVPSLPPSLTHTKTTTKTMTKDKTKQNQT